ncbi:MAG: C45 family peptidase [bacterium]
MMRSRRISGIVFAAAILAAVLQLTAISANAAGVEKVNGLYLVKLEGTPYEMGLQQGTLFKEEIRDVYKIYLNDLIYKKWIKEYAILKGAQEAYANPKKSMAKFAKTIESTIPPEYIEEMKGLAEGSGLTYEDVLNMSAHVDYFAMLMCSTFVATGKATTDGKLIQARNLDWASGGLKELDKYSTVFVMKPSKGHSFVSIIYPGIVGALTAVNDAGLTVELNFSMAKENGKIGMPALIIVRYIAQNAGTLDEAEKLLREIPRIAGYNIMLTDNKTNDARLVEITSKTVGVRNLNPDGTLVTTNHFTTNELFGQNIEASQFSQSPSPDRYNRLVELLKQNYGKIDTKMAMSIIHDDIVKVNGTVQTVVFKLSEDKIWVWTRSREPGDYAEFNVKELLAK